MGGVCRARNCFRSKDKCPDLPFFTFPKNPISAKKWMINIGDPELLKRPPSTQKNNVLCALHFEEKYFMSKKKRILVKNAVPTLFNIPPFRSEENQKKSKQMNSKQVSSEKNDMPVFTGGRIFSCDVETLDNWHREIDAVTGQLLSLLPDGSEQVSQFEPEIEKSYVEVGTQYETEGDKREFEDRLNGLDRDSNVDCSDSTPKIQLLCRLCSKLIHRECVVPVFSYEAEKMHLEDMINSIMAVTLTQDDGLPQQICNLCVRKLTFCFEVKNEFLASDRRLRDLLGITARNESSEATATKENNVDEAQPVLEPPPASITVASAEAKTTVQSEENKSPPADPKPEESAAVPSETPTKAPRKRRKLSSLSSAVKQKITKKIDVKPTKLMKAGPLNKKAEDSDFENDSSYEIQWYDEAYDDSVSEDIGNSDTILNNKKMSKAKKPSTSKKEILTKGPVNEEKSKKITEKQNVTTLNHQKLNESKPIDSTSVSSPNSCSPSQESISNDPPVPAKIRPGSVKVRLMTERQKALKLKNKARNKIMKQASKKKSAVVKNSCPECKQIFTSKWKLDRHVLVHLKFDCRDCDKLFKSAEELLIHNRGHISRKQKDVSNSGFRSQGNSKTTNQAESRVKIQTDSRVKIKLGSIAKNQSDSIAKNQSDSTAKNQSDSIAKNRSESIAKNQSESIAKDESDSTVKNQSDSAVKDQSDSVVKNQADSGGKNQADSGSKNQADSGGKNQADSGGKNQADSGDKEQADSGVTIPADPALMNRTCEVCKRVFKTRQRLVIHSKTHAVRVSYTCNICPKVFPSRIKLKQHLKGHKLQKTFKCSVCSDVFKNSKALFRHNIHHSKSSASLKCEMCDTFFTDVKELQKHREQQHLSKSSSSQINGPTANVANTDVTCKKNHSSVNDICANSQTVTAVGDTETVDTVKEDGVVKVKVPHLEKNLIITSSDQFVCEICDCKFSSKHFQEEHKKFHYLHPPANTVIAPSASSTEGIVQLPDTPERGKLYFCDQCGEGYERKRSLALHRFSHSSSHRCSYCHQSFSSEDSLVRHRESCVGAKDEISEGNR